jgi:hypothetical protein
MQQQSHLDNQAQSMTSLLGLVSVLFAGSGSRSNDILDANRAQYHIFQATVGFAGISLHSEEYVERADIALYMGGTCSGSQIRPC